MSEDKDTLIAQLKSQVFGLENMCGDYCREVDSLRTQLEAYKAALEKIAKHEFPTSETYEDDRSRMIYIAEEALRKGVE